MWIRVLSLTLAFGLNIVLAQTFKPLTNPSSPHIAGPNCWNQALISVSLLEVPRFTSDEEFLYLLNKNCVQIKNPTYGSLGRMNDQEGEVHAFIWVSESEVYGKYSLSAFEKPGFMPFQEMLNSYLRHEECTDTNPNPICVRQTTYYQCHNLAPEIKRQQSELNALDKTLNSIVFNPETMEKPKQSCNSDFIEARFKKMQIFIDQLNSFKQSGLITDKEYLKTWGISASEQIDEVEFSTYSETCLKSNSNFKKKFKLFEVARQSLKSITF